MTDTTSPTLRHPEIRLARLGGFDVDARRPEGEPIFRFGVIADPQYADAEPRLELNRYFRESLGKLARAIETFNDADLAFVVTLGDIIDRDFDSYAGILPLYERLRHPAAFILGNHDFAVAPERLASIPRLLGETSYYDFAGGGYRFILLDGNEISLFALPKGDPRQAIAAARFAALEAEGAINAQRWNGSLSDAQLAWLEAKLKSAEQAGERVIVMNHYPLTPENSHNAWDCQRILDLLARFDCVVAYLNGHNHQGNFDHRDGTYFVNFCGMVDTPDDNAFAIVSVYPERIEIEGFGREPSRTLALDRK